MQPPQPSNRTYIVGALIAAFGLIVAAIISTRSTVQVNVVVATNEALVGQVTEDAATRQTIQDTLAAPTSTFPSTDTSQPILPSVTPTLSPTSPPTPTSEAVLFEDNFDNGLSISWQRLSGNPIGVNGKLTADTETWLIVGDPSWKNYKVEFTDENSGCWTGGKGNAIAVRFQDLDNSYAMQWAGCEGWWNIVQNGAWNQVPISRFKPSFGYAVFTITITVNNDAIAVYINNEKKSSFSDQRFTQGMVGLRILAGATIENFKVTELP